MLGDSRCDPPLRVAASSHARAETGSRVSLTRLKISEKNPPQVPEPLTGPVLLPFVCYCPVFPPFTTSRRPTLGPATPQLDSAVSLPPGGGWVISSSSPLGAWSDGMTGPHRHINEQRFVYSRFTRRCGRAFTYGS